MHQELAQPGALTFTPAATAQRTRPALVLTVLALAGMVFAMLQSLVSPALPVLATEFNAPQNDLSWIVTAYLLAASVATPIAGRLGDMYGRRRVLLITLAILAAGALVAALADNLPLLIAGRALQGAGGAVLPLAFSIVRDELPPQKVGLAVGLLSALLGVGGGIGSVAAGPIIDHLSWNWLFWIPLILIGLAALGIALLVPASPAGTRGRVDFLGATLLSAALVCLLLPLTNADNWGWSSPLVISLFSAATVFLLLWGLAARRTTNALVDLNMVTHRSVWPINLAALGFGFATFGPFLLVPQLLQAPTETGYGFGKSVTEAGAYLLPATIAMIIFAPLSGALDRRFGSRLPLLTGSILTASSFTLLATARQSPWHVMAAMTLTGIGLGLSSAALTNAILSHVPRSKTAAATSINTLLRTIGGSISTAVLATILTIGATHDGLPGDASFTYGFTICAAAVVLAAIGAILLPRHRPPGNTDHNDQRPCPPPGHSAELPAHNGAAPPAAAQHHKERA
ncbi:MFS transporter [Streptomyces griseus]|uniref:MFS transporter n=1 Tax=Streptomyces griseus TaxID=1911 RepID=UPI00341EE2BB